MHSRLKEQLDTLSVSESELPRALLDRISETYDAHDQLEREVAQLNAFLDTVIDELPIPVFVKDATTLTYVRVNRATEKLFGAPRERILGRTLADLLNPTEAEHYEELDRRAVTSPAPISCERELLVNDGCKILNTILIPIRMEADTPRFILGISIDMTDRVVAADELRQQKELAERASRTKSDFLANMSHEMRTPLNAVVGFARVLLRDDSIATEEQRREFVGYIERAGDHMLALVNDLLDLRRVEGCGDALALSAEALPPLVDAALCMVGPILETRRHTFTLEGSGELPRALCNQRAFIQILINLLSNAAKYTAPGGSVTLRVGSDADGVELAVIDDGVGISHEDQQHLFTYFSRVGAKHLHQMQGSGVGLALTKALVENMGGTLSVTSAPGVGSTFTVRLARAVDTTRGAELGHDSGR